MTDRQAYTPIARRAALLLAVTAFAVVVAGCGASRPSSGVPEATPSPVPPAENPAAGGSRLAAGLYDQPDGTVLAIGTLAHSDLEGGFWYVSGGSAANGDAGTTVAVIANGDDLGTTLRPLEGSTVEVRGTRLDGASIRMAGPEVQASSVTAIDDTGAAAQ